MKTIDPAPWNTTECGPQVLNSSPTVAHSGKEAGSGYAYAVTQNFTQTSDQLRPQLAARNFKDFFGDPWRQLYQWRITR